MPQLWQYFVQRRSVCSALIEVLLLSCFFKRASVTPPFPRFSSYYSIIFLISLMIYVWTDVKSRQARNATAPKIFYAKQQGRLLTRGLVQNACSSDINKTSWALFPTDTGSASTQRHQHKVWLALHATPPAITLFTVGESASICVWKQYSVSQCQEMSIDPWQLLNG